MAIPKTQYLVEEGMGTSIWLEMKCLKTHPFFWTSPQSFCFVSKRYNVCSIRHSSASLSSPMSVTCLHLLRYNDCNLEQPFAKYLTPSSVILSHLYIVNDSNLEQLPPSALMPASVMFCQHTRFICFTLTLLFCNHKTKPSASLKDGGYWRY